MNSFSNYPIHYYNPRPGFTQQESLQLFSSCLHVPQEYLPAEAKAIHDECKVLFMSVKYGDEEFLFRVLLW